MSINKVVVKQTFGFLPTGKNCMAFCEDHHLAYISGHQVAVINTETKDQGFIVVHNPHLQYHSLGITAIACSLPKKYIAVAEKADPVAIVSLFDTHSLRRKKVLHYHDLGSREVKSISFSDDGKYCVTQGDSPEWNFVYWNVEKSPKIVATFKMCQSDDTPIHQVSFCPWDSTTVVIIGRGIFRVLRLIDGLLKPYTVSIRRDSANIISLCWLSNDHLLLGTEAGEILLIENFEFRAVVYPTGAPGEEVTPIHSFAPTSRGFVAGTIEGELRLFEYQEDIKEQYHMEDKYRLPSKFGNVISMAVGTDDTLVCATDSQQLYHISISNLYNTKAENHHGFEPILTSFHGPNSRGESAIVALDVASWRPIIASCGKDCSVRIWNPSEKKLELSKVFDEEPTALTMHPSGLYLAVGFNDKIKIFSILLDELALSHEIAVRSCTYLKFSHGGHYIAAVNSSTIQIFNTFTGTIVSTLRGHSNKIKSLRWMNADASLMSIGAEGVVYFWTLFPPNKRPQQFVGPVQFYSGTSLSDGSRAFVSTNERQLKEICFTRTIDPTTGIEGEIREPRDINIGTASNVMLIDESRRVLLMGTCDDDQPGRILGFIASPELNPYFESTSLHSGAVTTMALSSDGCYLVSADIHGVLCISEFEAGSLSSGNGGLTSNGSGKNTGKTREGLTSFEFVDEVMIKKHDFEQKKAMIADYSSRVEELTLNNEHQLRLKEMEHNDKVKDISTKFIGQLTNEKSKYESLFSEKQEMEATLRQRMKQLQDVQGKELREIEGKYKTKIAAESNRYKTLMSDIEEIHRRWNEDNAALVESHASYLKEMTEDYEDKLHEEQDTQRALIDEKENMTVEYEHTRNGVEEDGDIEIQDMKEKYELRLKHEEETGVELMAQHALMKKNLQLLTKDSDVQKEEIKRYRDKEHRLLDTIRSLEKDIQSHKKEIREREETITDKEKRIFDLKKKNQELEKFRFVLDYKIKELKLQIAPRENEITTMRKQIEDMALELEQYNKSNLALNLMIDELKLKLEGVRKEYISQEERFDVSAQLMDKIRRDLQELSECRDENGPLKAKMVSLYRVYVQEDLSFGSGNSSNNGEVNPQTAYNRDREQMERSLDALRKAAKTNSQAQKRDYCKIMRENVMLTNELNLLRKESRSLSVQQKAIEDVGSIGPHTDLSDLLDVLGIHVKNNNNNSNNNNSNNKQRGGAKGASNSMKSPSKSGLATLPEMEGDECRPNSSSSSKSTGNNKLNSTPGKRTPTSRTAALRTTSADGKVYSSSHRPFSKADNYEAWREVHIQHQTLQQLEDQLQAICQAVGLNHVQVLSAIEANIFGSLKK